MTTTQQPEDSFSFWSTDVLIGICFRVTPKHEQAGWVVTSAEVENYTEDELRAFAVEQLEDYGITVHDVNSMKSLRES